MRGVRRTRTHMLPLAVIASNLEIFLQSSDRRVFPLVCPECIQLVFGHLFLCGDLKLIDPLLQRVDILRLRILRRVLHE